MTGNPADGGPAAEAVEETGEEFEPDYRFTLANERTFLAWLRTAMALLATALAVVHLLPASPGNPTTTVVATALLALAVLSTVAGLCRWRRVQAAMRRGLPLPHNGAPAWFSAGLAAASVLVALVVLAGAMRS